MRMMPRMTAFVVAGLFLFGAVRCAAFTDPFRTAGHLDAGIIRTEGVMRPAKYHLKPVMYSDVVFDADAKETAADAEKEIDIGLRESRLAFNEYLFLFDIERDECIYLLDAENKPLDEQLEILKMKLRLKNPDFFKNK